jgi:hypothetical protein
MTHVERRRQCRLVVSLRIEMSKFRNRGRQLFIADIVRI